MPLSKKRMRERKRQDRFDKQHLSPYQANPVKPKEPELSEMWKATHPELDWYGHPIIDADGQPDFT